MKCLVCARFSLFHICKICRRDFLTPSPTTRTLPNGIAVLSMYRYEDIKHFLHTKHTDLGYHIYSILAKNAFLPFTERLRLDVPVAALAIDDRAKNAFSHTALLSKSLASLRITPLFGTLRAQNDVSYSGRSKAYRLTHPRNFRLRSFPHSQCIVVDDIVTTGTTLSEATNVLLQNGKKVLFCLVLADASL